MSDAPPPPGPPRWIPGLPTEHPRGTAVLVLGVLGLVACGLLGPIAWKLGTDAQREMDANPEVFWTNRASVTAGRICGMVGTGILAASAAFVLFAVVIAIAGG